MCFMGFRDYDPTTGRYIIPDIVDGEEDTPLSQNKYLYAEGDPINNIDPDGHWVIDAIFLAIDVVDFIKKPTLGKALMIGLDVLSFADPSGGTSTALHAAKVAIKTAKVVDHAVDGAKAVKRTVNVTKQISKAKKVYKVAKKTVKVEKAVDRVHDAAVAGDKVKDVVQKTVKAVSTKSGFKLTNHAIDQLGEARFGGKLSVDRLDELMHSKDAIRVIDGRNRNINVYVQSEFSSSSLMRITVPTDGMRIVSIGFKPLKRIEKFINAGGFIPLK